MNLDCVLYFYVARKRIKENVNLIKMYLYTVAAGVKYNVVQGCSLDGFSCFLDNRLHSVKMSAL